MIFKHRFQLIQIEPTSLDFSITVEPLLYDHPKNHIGVVV